MEKVKIMNSLDNPIWNALTQEQSALSQGNAYARRFLYEIGPLAGISDQSELAFASLARLANPGETMGLFLTEPLLALPSGWSLEADGMLTQMVCEREHWSPVSSSIPIELLGEADIPDMLALTQLTQPGPFRERTIDLGHYVGLREAGQLVAMAGQRLFVQGFREVSAVCTHPDFQGRGYAKILMTAVVEGILSRGEIPFLHSRADNLPAIKTYEKLGFRSRRLLNLAVLRRT